MLLDSAAGPSKFEFGSSLLPPFHCVIRRPDFLSHTTQAARPLEHQLSPPAATATERHLEPESRSPATHDGAVSRARVFLLCHAGAASSSTVILGRHYSLLLAPPGYSFKLSLPSRNLLYNSHVVQTFTKTGKSLKLPSHSS